jgi:hypothetical protein
MLLQDMSIVSFLFMINSRFAHFFWSSRNCQKSENLGTVMVLAISLNLPEITTLF